MKVTQKLINQIAKDSKDCCHNGHGMSVFADGSTMFAVSSNDVCARSDSDGGWDYRVAYVSTAMTRAQAKEFCDEIFS
jgi:hypothetical protein